MGEDDMSKPTDYQRWWMERILGGEKMLGDIWNKSHFIIPDDLREQVFFASVRSAINNGWIIKRPINSKRWSWTLTPAGRKVLEK